MPRERLQEALAESKRVREELGYPPLVSPLRQMVAKQAVLNVVGGVRLADPAVDLGVALALAGAARDRVVARDSGLALAEGGGRVAGDSETERCSKRNACQKCGRSPSSP